MYYTYVLLSNKDNKRYIGTTSDLKRRLKEHNNGQVASTKSRIPLKLIYYEACLDKEKAQKREKYLKSNFGRQYLNSRI